MRAVLLVALLVLASTARGEEPIDPSRMLAAVELHESGGEVDPDDAVGKGGELGRYQIKPGTRILAGCGGKNAWLMTKPAFSRGCAEKIIEMCLRKGWHTVFAVAFCYNQGPYARISKRSAGWGYAYKTMMEYQRLGLRRESG